MSKPTLGYASRTDAVLALKGEGRTLAEIAAALDIEAKTVSALIASAERKRGERPPPEPRRGAALVVKRVEEEARRTAERRHQARRLSGTSKAYLNAGPDIVEQVATALAEDPADVVTALRRRWPDVWQRVLEASRDAGTLPFGLMVDAIEIGLDALDQRSKA